MDSLSVKLTLILVIAPVGNIPKFLSVLRRIEDQSSRRSILIQDLLLALGVLVVFLFLGRHLLQWLDLRP